MRNWAIQTSFLGDAVLTLPFIYRLLERGEEVLVVAAPRNISIFERAAASGLKKWSSDLKIVSWDKKKVKAPWEIYKFARQLKGSASPPDNCYCVHRSFSSSLLGLFSGADKKIGFSTGAASFFYTDLTARNWDTGQLEIEKNLDLLRSAAPCEAWPLNAPSLLGQKNSRKDVVAFSLGSPWATKEWNLDQAASCIKKLVAQGLEVWLLGDKNFAPKSEYLVKAAESKLVKNYSGQTGINEWIDLISEAGVLVSGDSAAVHVACDLDVPVVALFGPTVTEFGFAPWRKNARVIALDMACRPCDIHGPKICPLGHHKCMKDLDASSVTTAIQEILR